MVYNNLSTYLEFMDKRNKYKYVCLFGAGYAADSCWYQFVIDRGFNVNFFSDNDKNKWGKVIVDNIICIPPYEILRYGKDVLCLVSTSVLYMDEIVLQLKSMGLDAIGLDFHWFNIKSIIEYYLNIEVPDVEYSDSGMGEYNREIGKNERMAVYTCIIDDYDDLKQPQVIDEQCDYFCLSLNRPQNLGVYQWIDISRYIGDDISDNTRINRFCKLHPHLFFKDYRYSVYYDGSFEIIHSIAGVFKKIGNVGIALYEAGGYGNLDIYGEAALLILSKRTSGDAADIIVKQISKYIKEGFPRNYGEAMNGTIVREHNNPRCIKIMEIWWKEIINESRRDQLSFWYSVWKNGYSPQDIGRLGESLKSGSEYFVHNHKKKLYKDYLK